MCVLFRLDLQNKTAFIYRIQAFRYYVQYISPKNKIERFKIHGGFLSLSFSPNLSHLVVNISSFP